MIKRISICTTLIIFTLTIISCSSAKPPGQDDGKTVSEITSGQQGNRTFDEIYADYISDDEEKIKKAKTELNVRLEEFYPKLVEVAALQDPAKSPKAIEMIKEYNNDEARDVILKGLDSEHREIIIASVIASGPQKDERAFDRLMELSYSEDKGIRGNCATAIANFPDHEEVGPRLRELTEDSERAVRMATYASLGKISDPETDRLLYEALKSEAESMSPDDEETGWTLLIISKALGEVVDEEDCEWLVDGLDKTNPDELRYTLFDTVAKLHCAEAVDPLMKICRDTDEKDMTRFRAGFSLAYIGDTRGLKAADDIYFATEHGEFDINELNFPSFTITMRQYRQLLNEAEIAARIEE